MLNWMEENKGIIITVGACAIAGGLGYYYGKKKGAEKASKVIAEYSAIANNKALSAEEKAAASVALFNNANK